MAVERIIACANQCFVLGKRAAFAKECDLRQLGVTELRKRNFV